MVQKKLVVLGGGESGIGAAILGELKGFDVFLSDRSPIDDKYREVLLRENINFEEGFHGSSDGGGGLGGKKVGIKRPRA